MNESSVLQKMGDGGWNCTEIARYLLGGGCKQQLNHRRTEANGRSEEMIVNKLE